MRSLKSVGCVDQLTSRLKFVYSVSFAPVDATTRLCLSLRFSFIDIMSRSLLTQWSVGSQSDVYKRLTLIQIDMMCCCCWDRKRKTVKCNVDQYVSITLVSVLAARCTGQRLNNNYETVTNSITSNLTWEKGGWFQVCLLKTFKCCHAALSGNIFPAAETVEGTERSDDGAINRMFYEWVFGSDTLIF